jgi:ferrous iron transport protein A
LRFNLRIWALNVKNPPPLKAVPLTSLCAGQVARIVRIIGRAEHVHHLEEFGLRKGTKLQMFRRGNPCIIRLSGSKVCLRSDDMLSVLVEPAV